MGKRSRHADPNDPTQWIGQPYIPQDRYGYLTPGRFRSSPQAPILYGCLLLGGLAFAGIALIAAGLAQTYGPGFWALVVLIGAAIIGTTAAVASTRHRRQAREKQRHHHHHKDH